MSEQDRPLEGRVALVTGGGRGLGQAYATTLAAAGASVAVAARSADQVAETVGAIEHASGRARGYTADVADPSAVKTLVAQVVRDFGPIDILVNNAGSGGSTGPFAEGDPDVWWRVQEVNLRGVMLCTHAVLPGMIERKHGRIINISSAAGLAPIPYLSAYVVSKTALIRFTEIVAAEVRDAGVAVFAISPGPVRTAMSEEVLATEEGQRWMPWFLKIFEEGRDVPAQLSADLVLALARGDADTLSGRFLSIRDDLAAHGERQRNGTLSPESLTLRLRGVDP